MPNWFHNNLTVYGPREKVEQFIKRAEGPGDDPLAFNVLFPRPEGVEGESSLDWEYENWGCKWGAVDAKRDEVIPYVLYAGVHYYCRTANGVPAPLFGRVAEDFPELTFTLRWKEYISYTGLVVWKGGECVLEECRDLLEGVDYFCNVHQEDGPPAGCPQR